MKSRKERNAANVKLGRIENACGRYSLGRTTLRKLAEQAGAVVRIGSCYLIDFTVMDAYFDRIRNELASARQEQSLPGIKPQRSERCDVHAR